MLNQITHQPWSSSNDSNASVVLLMTENQMVQYYLKNYTAKTEEIITMVRNFMLEDEDFKDIVGDLKIELIITLKNMEVIANTIIEKGMTKYIRNRLYLFLSTLTGDSWKFTEVYGMKQRIIDTLEMKNANLLPIRTKSIYSILDNLLRKAYIQMDGPSFYKEYSWNVMNLNLFLDREFALAMQLIKVIRKTGKNE